MFRWMLALLGVVGLVTALPLLFSGGSLVWVDTVLTDSDGFINSMEAEVEVDGFALVSGPAEIESLPDLPQIPLRFDDVATIRIMAENLEPDVGIFVGLAEVDAMEAYIGGVPHAVVDDVSEDGFTLLYRTDVAGDVPSLPTDQTFWTASASGLGEQVLEWNLEEGSYLAIVMNENAADGLAFRTTLGARVPLIGPVGVGLLIGGGLALALGTVLLAIAL